MAPQVTGASEREEASPLVLPVFSTLICGTHGYKKWTVVLLEMVWLFLIPENCTAASGITTGADEKRSDGGPRLQGRSEVLVLPWR